MYYNVGTRYEGDWKNDKREGKGIFYNLKYYISLIKKLIKIYKNGII